MAKTHRNSPLLIGLVLLLPAFANADKADDVVRAAMKNYNIPGVSVAVIREGKVVKLKGYGYANLEHKVKVTPQTIFETGSIAKQFTAALVMKLVEDGKLKLEDSIRKYLPDAPETWEKITIRHILAHTSGLSRDVYEKLAQGKEYTDEEKIKIEYGLPILFEPGADWSYSNVGYHVVAFLCTKVGGKPFGEQLRSRLFDPAGMKTACLVSEEDLVMNRAMGYLSLNGTLYNQPWSHQTLNSPGPGGLYVSLLDMVSWNVTLDGEKLFSQNVKQQMWSPNKLTDGKTVNYGFGWLLGPTNGHKGVHHSGAWRGFRTSIRRYPDDKLAVIVLMNGRAMDPHKLSQQIAACYVPELVRLPAKAVPDTAPESTKVLISFLDGNATNAKKLMTTEMWEATKTKWFDDQIKELKQHGVRNLVEPIRISETGREVVYRVRYGKHSLLINMFLDEKGLIEGFGTDIDD